MKSIFITLFLYCYVFINVNAQCNNLELNKTTNPNVDSSLKFLHKRNFFDWTKTNFSAFVQGRNLNIVSPFYQSNSNATIKYFSMSIKDNKPENGWELLAENFGYVYDTKGNKVIIGDGVKNPYFLLYNKYTGLTRLFVTVGLRHKDYSKYKIQVEYNNASNNSDYLIGNNIADTSQEFPILPLNQFKRGINNLPISSKIITIDRFPNQGGNENLQWIASEFYLSYDPCNCKHNYKFKVSLDLLKVAIYYQDDKEYEIILELDSFGSFNIELPSSNGSNFTGIEQTSIPYYNYPLGITALLKTPKIYYYRGFSFYDNYSLGKFCSKIDINSLKYTINPFIFDTVKSKVYVSLSSNQEIGHNDVITYKSYIKQKSNKQYATEFVPIECANDLMLNYNIRTNDVNRYSDASNYFGNVDFAVTLLYKLVPLNKDTVYIQSVKYKLESEERMFYPNTKKFYYEENSIWESFPRNLIQKLEVYNSAEENTINPWNTLSLVGTKYEIAKNKFIEKGFLKAGESIKLVPDSSNVPTILKTNDNASLSLKIESPVESCIGANKGLLTDLSSFCLQNNSENYNPIERVIQGSSDELPNEKNEINTKCFPNPATNRLNVSLSDLQQKNLEIKLIDILGIERMILFSNKKQEVESFIFKFDISTLEIGTYFVEVNIENQIERIPIVVLR